MAEPHSSPIKTPRQLVAVVAVAFVAPIVVIALLAALVTSGTKGGSSDPKVIAERIKPAGTLVVEEQPIPATAAVKPDPKPAAPIVVATIPPPAAAGASSKTDGKSVYDTACAACHAAGVAGAPKFGDKSAWAPRLAAGKDAMHAAAIKGKGAMPAKGGQLQLSDEQVRSAVDFMAAAVK